MIPEGNGLGQVGLRSEQACDSVLQMWSVCVWSCAMSRCVGRCGHDVCDVLRVQFILALEPKRYHHLTMSTHPGAPSVGRGSSSTLMPASSTSAASPSASPSE